MATSTLNPNAPIYVPSAYREIEDFSEEWWDLVHSSSWFRDYWLRECFSDPQIDPPSIQVPDFTLVEEIGNGNAVDDAASKGWMEWRKPRGRGTGAPSYSEKAPRIVKVKMNPRPIQLE